MTKVAALVRFAASERPTSHGLTVRDPTENASMDRVRARLHTATPVITTAYSPKAIHEYALSLIPSPSALQGQPC